jgi:hypothetical protein
MVSVGAWFPTLKTLEDARRVARSLGRSGSCLSRSLAVASRLPTADVVIGVHSGEAEPLFAHAWIEMNGVPVDPSEVAGKVIARLYGRRSSGRSLLHEGGD